MVIQLYINFISTLLLVLFFEIHSNKQTTIFLNRDVNKYTLINQSLTYPIVNQLISKFNNNQVSGKFNSEHYLKASLEKGGSRSQSLMDISHLYIVNDIHSPF